MYFLYRTQPAVRSLTRPSSRLFTSTAIQNKSSTEAVKDTVKTLDRKASDAVVSGIETAEQAAAKAREVAGLKTEEAKAKTEQAASQASSKAQEVKHETKGKMYEAEGKAKATAEEVKAKGKANM
ncbi:hypothetical protein GJ744_012260 [Endocarpon pusillum]|uniref:LEA domain protein n=1 Tax=Endocarpon pusillum TaxID=364733 RepID=A0A8H7E0I3_9EURO|nr:hypothetical protein GJ744_012260 [Endocarpon pusillum]